MSEDFSTGAGRAAIAAMQHLGWSPEQFWTATPAELRLALGPVDNSATAPSRAEIEKMIERDRDGR